MVQQLPETFNEAMELLPQAFKPEKAGGANAVVQISTTGSEPGSWIITVRDGKCEVEQGAADSPSVTINTPSDVWLKIMRRELDGSSAFMSGQFTFTGDMGVLMQFGSWFDQS
jgi:putative sterol carrier protein